MIRINRNIVLSEKDEKSATLDAKMEEVFEPQTDLSQQKDIPPNKLYGHNLKTLKSYNKIRKGYKLSNQKAIFMQDIKTILKEFPHDKHQYDDELLVEVLNIAESYFIYGNAEDREKAKCECINDLMLPYFKDDVALLFKTIGHVWCHVKKTTLFRRLCSRFKNFFFKTKKI